MSSHDDDSKQEELLSYREEVCRELERRSTRIKEIDAQIAATQYELEASQRERVLMGQTPRILAQVAYQQRLKRKLSADRRDRSQALDDLRRAEIRLAEIDSELLTFEDEVNNEGERDA